MWQQYEHIGKVVKIDIEGLRRRWSSSWSNSASEHARDLILVSMRSLDLNSVAFFLVPRPQNNTI